MQIRPIDVNFWIVSRCKVDVDDIFRCGHVHGFHNWGHKKGGESKERTCPLCSTVGPFVALSMSYEAGVYTDCGPLTHAFFPCGHMASEKTAT